MTTPLQAKAEAVIYSNICAEEINLEGLGLESFDDILPALAQCSNLRTLKLARNKITSLPESLTQLAGLEYLDLAGNPIEGLNFSGIAGLANLKQLYINLPDFLMDVYKEDIIMTLESLEIFNGNPVRKLNQTSESPGGEGGGDEETTDKGPTVGSPTSAPPCADVAVRSPLANLNRSKPATFLKASGSIWFQWLL